MNGSTPERLARSGSLALFTCLLAGFMLFGSAAADVPSTMTYQGRLTTPAGAPMPGTYNMTFKIWSDECSGDSLWAEDHNNITEQVEVNYFGLFEVLLGQFIPLTPSVFPEDGSTPYLEVIVDGEALRPCKPLNAVPYAQVPAGAGGPTGPTGPVGPTGPAGSTGPAGTPGAWSLVASIDFISQPSVQITGLAPGKYYKVFYRFRKQGAGSTAWGLIVNSWPSEYYHARTDLTYATTPVSTSYGHNNDSMAVFITALDENNALTGEMMISTDSNNTGVVMGAGHWSASWGQCQFGWSLPGYEALNSFTIAPVSPGDHALRGNITVYELREE